LTADGLKVGQTVPDKGDDGLKLSGATDCTIESVTWTKTSDSSNVTAGTDTFAADTYKAVVVVKLQMQQALLML